MVEIYQLKDLSKVKSIILAVEASSLLSVLVTTIYGYVALISHKLTSLYWFNLLIAFQIPLCALLIYVNPIYAFLLLTTMLIWVYLRYVKTLLLALLVSL